MLTLFAKHALFNLEVRAKGDVQVDFHHTVEDTGIVLGQALGKALGDKKGLVRYGNFHLPMDETLVRVALDFSGRPLLVWRAPKGLNLNRLKAGDFPAQLTVEFLRAFAQEAGLTLHVEVLIPVKRITSLRRSSRASPALLSRRCAAIRASKVSRARRGCCNSHAAIAACPPPPTPPPPPLSFTLIDNSPFQ